jgi:hypothetical protein
MDIRLLLWDGANQLHLAEHVIRASEVNEMMELDNWVVSSHPRYSDQVRITGHTRGGRWLTVALEPTADSETWRPVTGWESTADEIRYWHEQQRG